MRSQFASVIAVAAAVAIQSVEAYWGTSHILVATEAQIILEQTNPDVFAAALAELSTLKASHASLTTRENKHPFAETATFADDVKSTYSFQSTWHFIDQPYLDKGGSLSDFTFKADVYEIVSALTNLTQWLSNSGTDYKTSYYYQQIIKNFPVEADARSFALRLVIHYVGDIHQPLHTVALVDSTYPSGDAGGNKEYLPSICGASNLHAVWDSVAYNYCGYPVQPLSDADWLWYETEAGSINDQYPVDDSKLYSGDFTQWAQEGYDLAVSTVYPGVVVNKALSAEYVAACDQASRTRMMQGAHRLAALMVDIYGSGNFLQ